MFKIAICDDDIAFIELEKQIIQKVFKSMNSEVEIDEYLSGESLLALTEHEIDEYNLIFLDVDMEHINGIETAKRIREKSQVYIAFLTGFIDYALEGYKVDAIRYVLKDMNNIEEAIYECIITVMERIKKQPSYTLTFRETKIKCALKNIVSAESRLHYVMVTIANNGKYYEYSMRTTLDDFEKKINHKNMLRIHKSILVNAEHIKSIKRYIVTLSNNSEYSISQTRYKYIKQLYAKYLGEF